MKTQKGRSMIEMLGVLAIIGVLSVGGLAGYTRAMRSYRTNEILEYEGKCYVQARSQGNGIGELNVSCTDNLPTGITAGGVNCLRSAGGRTSCSFTVSGTGIAPAIGQKVGITCADAQPLFRHSPGLNPAWVCVNDYI